MASEPEPGAAGSAGRRDFLSIDGMFCAACAASVEAVLNRHPQVAAASVNFAADAAVVDWSPGASGRERLLQDIRRLGYRARLIGDGDALEAQDSDPARDLGLRLVVAAFFGMWAMLPAVSLYFDVVTDPAARLGLAWAAGALSLPVVLYSGLPFYRMGLATLRHRIAGVDALVLLGVAGSMLLSGFALARGSADVYFEVAVALVTLQLVARLLDLRVRRRARDAVIGLIDIAPTTVRVLDASGAERDVVLGEVGPGARVRVRTGERIAVDGTVLAGEAEVDRSLLSGEAEPVRVAAPAMLHAGERVLEGAVTLEVTAGAGKRRIDQLARQVRQMLAQKPAWQRAVDRAAGHFLWLAALAAVLGFGLVLSGGGSPSEAGARALAVFVIACPCALSLAAPLAGLVASAAAARRGMILRDLNAITSAAAPDRLFLDKTGTLTRGAPCIVAVHPAGGRGADEVLALAAAAEADSDHPVASAIRAAAGDRGRTTAAGRRGSSRIAAGYGVVRNDDGVETRVGRLGWLERAGISIPALPATEATRVGVAVGSDYIGAIDLEDTLRGGMRRAIDALRDRGIEPVILSGDAPGPVGRVAKALDVAAFAGLTPEQKVEKIHEARRDDRTVAFAGDGLNDAPALAAADLGIAVGDATDAARSAAAVALVETDATALPGLFDLTARTRKIIRQNLAWAIAYNAIAIPAAVSGWVHPAIAAAAMALSSITIVLNALRAGRTGRA